MFAAIARPPTLPALLNTGLARGSVQGRQVNVRQCAVMRRAGKSVLKRARSHWMSLARI